MRDDVEAACAEALKPTLVGTCVGHIHPELNPLAHERCSSGQLERTQLLLGLSLRLPCHVAEPGLGLLYPLVLCHYS